MRIRKPAYFVFALIVVSCSSPREDSVAVVNGKTIPASEFGSRLEAYIRATGVRDNILLRQSVVMNMIHESLILEDAERLGWESDSEGKRRICEIQTQALLDAYAKELMREVNVSPISEDDLQEEFRKRNTRVSARYVYAPTEQSARTLKRRLENGESFKTVAGEIFDDPGLAENGGYVGYFGPGEMDEEFESAAFTLPVGSLSDPVRIGAGYAVLRVEDKKMIPLQSEQDYAKVKHELEAGIREKRSREVLERKAEGLSRQGNAVIDEKLLSEVFEYWKSPQADPESRLAVRPSEKVVVRFDIGSWTSEQILEHLLSLSEKQRKRIKTGDDFTKAVRGLIARDKLVDLAKRSGLEHDAAVAKQVQNVRMNYLLTRWMKKVEQSEAEKSVSEDELLALFNKDRDGYVNPPEVRVKEILVRDRKTADALVREIRSGMDFSAVAKRSSIRRWAAERGGDLGFGTRTTFGAMAEKFFEAKIGQLIGPEQVDPYYGIFKVTERREGRRKTLDEAREQLESDLQAQRKKQAVERALADLRKGAVYSIDDEVMKNTAVRSMNSAKESMQ